MTFPRATKIPRTEGWNIPPGPVKRRLNPHKKFPIKKTDPAVLKKLKAEERDSDAAVAWVGPEQEE